MAAPLRSARTRTLLFLAAALLVAAGGVYNLVAARGQARQVPQAPPLPALLTELTPGAVARMDSPVFDWSPGWHVREQGADPAEPADPALSPSGIFTFTYTGSELALQLAVGNYWGFLYVTVDGAAANLLPISRGHAPPAPQNAGYRPLYAPELVQEDGSPAEQWVRVHRLTGIEPGEVEDSSRGGAGGRQVEPVRGSSTLHTARVEVWRSWGQTPIRAVAVDALPLEQYRYWPGVLMLVAAAWLATPLWAHLARLVRRAAALFSMPNLGRWLLAPERQRPVALVALAGLALLLTAVLNGAWSFGALGLLLLGAAGIVWPALWYAALLAALPFYYTFALPLLPARALNLVDTGVFLGLGVALAHAALVVWSETHGRARRRTRANGTPGLPRVRFAPAAILLLALLASWALVSTFAAERFGVALREWRTVFLMGAALAAGLLLTLRVSRAPRADVTLLVGAWLAGAAVMAALVLLRYPSPEVTIPAEGVTRLRGFYGSPNNLALYLGRTLAVALALALFLREPRLRLLCLLLALPQAAALVLTFSRGALFVGLPLLFATLWIGGYAMLRRQERPKRVLWAIVLLVALAGTALLPFAGTDRLQQLISTAQGTGFLRVNLWRSAWQMALDHPLLGVGPDNFLYAYRSGYILPQAWMEPDLNHPHTWLLDAWTRIGLPGMLLLLAFWAMVLLGSVRGLAVRGWGALYVGLLAGTLAALAHGLVDVSYALPDLMAVWALFGVLATVELLPFDD